MIETIQAVNNLHLILSVKCLKAIYIGPRGFFISMGYEPKGDQEETEVTDIIKYELEAFIKNKILAGVHNITTNMFIKC